MNLISEIYNSCEDRIYHQVTAVPKCWIITPLIELQFMDIFALLASICNVDGEVNSVCVCVYIYIYIYNSTLDVTRQNYVTPLNIYFIGYEFWQIYYYIIYIFSLYSTCFQNFEDNLRSIAMSLIKYLN